MNETLRRMLKSLSYQKREVTLASGRKSDFYIDCKKLFMRQDGLVLCADALLNRLRLTVTDDRYGWDVCRYAAGSGLGGGPLSAAMSVHAYARGNTLDLLYVRNEAKDHGTRRRVEPEVPRVPDTNRNVVFIEDVITTGASAISAVRALREDGWHVQGVIALVDRQEGGVENINREGPTGTAVSALFTKDSLLED